MSTMQHTVIAARRAAGVAAFAALAALPFAARAQTFAAKPGEWELTSMMRGNAVPPEQLARMTPQQRAEVERMIAEHGGADGQSTTRKTCIRREDLDRDDFGRPPGESNCTTKRTSRTATKVVLATKCSGPPPLTGAMEFEAKTPELIIGSIDQQRPDGSTFHVGIVGKWLRATCDESAGGQ